MTILPLPFQFRYLFFLSFFFFFFFVWLLWLGLPILCWIEAVRMVILVLFQILAGRLSAFHCWVLYWLWVCENQGWPYLPYNTAAINSLSIDPVCAWLQNLPTSWRMTGFSILGILLLILWLLVSVLHVWYLVSVCPTYLTPGMS